MKLLVSLLVTALPFSLMAADAAPTPVPTLDLTGSVQLQMQKATWDNVKPGTKSDNLDELWGRVNFGAKFKADGFSSEVNIRAFPVGFGYEALTGLTVKDSTDTISLTVKKTGIEKVQIEQAWVKYSWGIADLKIGRMSTITGRSVTLGNYLDLDPGTAFQGKVGYHNALEFTAKKEISTTTIMLGAGDAKLNTGYLRIWEQVVPFKGSTLAAGYRSNVFDLGYDENAFIDNRLSFTGDYEIMKDFKPYVEVGIIKKAARTSTQEDSSFVPLLFGSTIPTKGFLNTLGVEIEYLKDRKGVDIQKTGAAAVTKKPVVFQIYADKKFGTRTRLQFALMTDQAGASAGDLRIALRYTGTLK